MRGVVIDVLSLNCPMPGGFPGLQFTVKYPLVNTSLQRGFWFPGGTPTNVQSRVVFPIITFVSAPSPWHRSQSEFYLGSRNQNPSTRTDRRDDTVTIQSGICTSVIIAAITPFVTVERAIKVGREYDATSSIARRRKLSCRRNSQFSASSGKRSATQADLRIPH